VSPEDLDGVAEVVGEDGRERLDPLVLATNPALALARGRHVREDTDDVLLAVARFDRRGRQHEVEVLAVPGGPPDVDRRDRPLGDDLFAQFLEGRQVGLGDAGRVLRTDGLACGPAEQVLGGLVPDAGRRHRTLCRRQRAGRAGRRDELPA